MLSGLLQCGICGSSFGISGVKVKAGIGYYQYSCRAYATKGSTVCSNSYRVSEKKLNEAIARARGAQRVRGRDPAEADGGRVRPRDGRGHRQANRPRGRRAGQEDPRDRAAHQGRVARHRGSSRRHSLGAALRPASRGPGDARGLAASAWCPRSSRPPRRAHADRSGHEVLRQHPARGPGRKRGRSERRLAHSDAEPRAAGRRQGQCRPPAEDGRHRSSRSKPKLRGQDLNLRPSGYEAAQAGMQTSSAASNPSGSLDVLTEHPVPPIEPKSTEHKNFGQPVVSVSPSFDDTEHRPLTPAEAAKRFQIPEYLLRRACAEGALEHLRVVNSLWLAPTAVEEFACAWRARKTRNQD